MLHRFFSCACLGALWLLLAAVEVSARDLPQAQPERVGLSAERLERLTAHMNQAVDDGAIAGGVGMIVRRGRVAYLAARVAYLGPMDRLIGRPPGPWRRIPCSASIP